MSQHDWLSAYLFFNGWIYSPDCDRIALDVAEPFVRRCQDEGWTDQHFFIRYSENGPHVRLRLHGDREVLHQTVWPALVAHVQAMHPDVVVGERPAEAVWQREETDPLRVTHVVLVEYEPETDRYGGPDALLVGERMFEGSSDTAYALIAKMGTERSSRLGKGLLTMVITAHVFLEDRERGAAFSRMYSGNYLRALAPEDEGRTPWLEAFDKGYEQQSATLAEYVDAIWEAMDDGDSLSDTLDAYADALRARRAELRALFDEGRVQAGGAAAQDWQQAVGTIVPSYVHMMNNRLGVTIQEESYLAYLVNRALSRPAEAATPAAG